MKIVEKTTTPQAYALIINKNWHLTKGELLQLIHGYISIRDAFSNTEHDIYPIKNGVAMHSPFIGKVSILFPNETNKHMFSPFNEKQIQKPVNSKHKTLQGEPKYFYHTIKNIYIHSENTLNSVRLSNHEKIFLYDSAKLVAQVKSAIDSFKIERGYFER